MAFKNQSLLPVWLCLRTALIIYVTLSRSVELDNFKSILKSFIALCDYVRNIPSNVSTIFDTSGALEYIVSV